MLLALPASRPPLRHSSILPTALTIACLLGSHAASASPINSGLLIDPAGENDGDTFGCSVARVGDVNDDGYDDLIVGANYYPTLSGHGRAYLFFGGPQMDAVADLVLPSPLSNSSHFGISVASAGDFNGDGHPDFIVGARYAGLPGQAFVYYGGPLLDATPDLTLSGEATGASTFFGNCVAPAGDVNGDGFDDVIVGSPEYRNAAGNVGRAYVYYGGSTPDAIPDRTFTGAAAGDELGWVVGCAGDMNGDGHPDVFAIALSNDAGGIDAGAIYVWFGGPGFDTTADLTVLGSGSNARLSHAAGAGDINADGFSDLIVSERSRTQIIFGGPVPDALADLTLARSFATVAGAGDVNGDGRDDFILGDPGDDTGGVDAGRVSVFYGGTAVDTVEDLYFVGDRPGRFLGRVVAAAGQVDGQEPADLIASAAEDPEGVGYDSGRVYVFSNAFDITGVPMTPTQGLSFVGALPNPAWSDVNLVLDLDHEVSVRVSVYDVQGREVARPVVNERLSGHVTRTWRPQTLPSGIYYVSTKLGGKEQVRKLVWLGHSR